MQTPLVTARTPLVSARTPLVSARTPLVSARTPLVSVTLIAYNAEAYIKDAIEGCLMQQVDFPYELIIHDDASKDQTPQIIAEYAKQYPDKIIPIFQTENQFSTGNEIYAEFIVPKARGKYIAFMEADDYWIDPLKLQKQIDFMENHPDFSMCFTATKEIRSSGTKTTKIKRYRNRDSVCSAKDVIFMGGRLVDMISVVVRKKIYDSFPEWYQYSQMWDSTIPLLALTHGKIQYLNNVTAVYRQNVSGSWTQGNVRNFSKRIKTIQRNLALLDGFNEGTDFRFDKLIEHKTRLISMGLLLLLNPQEEDFKKYYSRLSPSLKLEYKIFKAIGSYRLWERYRQVMRLFRKIKQI